MCLTIDDDDDGFFHHFTRDYEQQIPNWKNAFEVFKKTAAQLKKIAAQAKVDAENKVRDEEAKRSKKDSRVTIMENNHRSESERKQQIDAADAKRTADKAKADAEARLQIHEANKSKKVFREFFEANSEMFRMATGLHGLGFMSGYGRRLKEMQAFADGKKPKTRWNKNIDINENN